MLELNDNARVGDGRTVQVEIQTMVHVGVSMCSIPPSTSSPSPATAPRRPLAALEQVCVTAAPCNTTYNIVMET